jgi:hypothetical protein
MADKPIPLWLLLVVSAVVATPAVAGPVTPAARWTAAGVPGLGPPEIEPGWHYGTRHPRHSMGVYHCYYGRGGRYCPELMERLERRNQPRRP